MTTFACPECHNREIFEGDAAMSFRYGAVWVLMHDVELTEYGYVANKGWSTLDIHDNSTIICAECGYEGEESEFTATDSDDALPV